MIDLQYKIEVKELKENLLFPHKKDILVPFFCIDNIEETKEVITDVLKTFGYNTKYIKLSPQNDYEYTFYIDGYKTVGSIQITPILTKDNEHFELNRTTHNHNQNGTPFPLHSLSYSQIT